jgi:hypothetical protein
MIGGAVVGGLVGNQIGHGTTNTLATVGGAAGGAYVGNEIGKRVETHTRYKVVVRMDDGRKKTFSYAARPQFAAGSPRARGERHARPRLTAPGIKEKPARPAFCCRCADPTSSKG